MIQHRVEEGTQDCETVTEDLRQLGDQLLGKISGNMKQGNETWWWNEDVQEFIQTKKLAKITLDNDNCGKRTKLHIKQQRRKQKGT